MVESSCSSPESRYCRDPASIATCMHGQPYACWLGPIMHRNFTWNLILRLYSEWQNCKIKIHKLDESLLYRIVGKFGDGPWFVKLKPSKLVLTINDLLADLPNFLSPSAQKESIHQPLPPPNFPTIWYIAMTSSTKLLKL